MAPLVGRVSLAVWIALVGARTLRGSCTHGIGWFYLMAHRLRMVGRCQDVAESGSLCTGERSS